MVASAIIMEGVYHGIRRRKVWLISFLNYNLRFLPFIFLFIINLILGMGIYVICALHLCNI